MNEPDASGRPDPHMDELRSEFGSIMDLLNEGPSDIAVEEPSPSVWAGIESVLADERSSSERADRVPPMHRTASEPVIDVTDSAPVVSLDAARERRGWGKRTAVLVAVAAAALLVALPIGLSTRSSGVELAADLDALDGFAGSGRAELDDGTLTLDVEGLSAPDGSFYELWLLDLEDGEVADLRSIGRIADDGSYVLDENIDLDEFTVVDISIEEDDGDDSHSGNSVLRGPLS